MSNPYLYLIMRGDMPSMNPGKLAAQAAHGASMFHEAANRAKVDFDHMTEGQIGPGHWYLGYSEWVRQAKDFGTTIVLTATHQEIENLHQSVMNFEDMNDFVFDNIIDPSYPFTMETEIFNYLKDNPNQNVEHLFQNVSDLGNGRTFATREERSGFWIFGDKDVLAPYLGHLKLYP